MPEVSIVIPAYNAARYVAQAVESALAQTFDDIEVVVVDDGSTDETADVIGGFGSQVRHLSQPNSGVSVARNKGIAQGTGRYVAFLDADDTWHPEKLEKQLGAMQRSGSRFGLCYSAFQISGADLEPIGVRGHELEGGIENLLVEGNVVGSPSTVLCERELLRMTGGFDPGLSQCADWDMWIRLAAMTRFIRLDEPLVNYRQHGTSMSGDPGLLEQDSLRVLEKAFAMPDLDPGIRAQRHRAFAHTYMVLAGTYFRSGRYRDFARCALRSVRLDPRGITRLAGFPLRVAKRSSSADRAEV